MVVLSSCYGDGRSKQGLFRVWIFNETGFFDWIKITRRGMVPCRVILLRFIMSGRSGTENEVIVRVISCGVPLFLFPSV